MKVDRIPSHMLNKKSIHPKNFEYSSVYVCLISISADSRCFWTHQSLANLSLQNYKALHVEANRPHERCKLIL